MTLDFSNGDSSKTPLMRRIERREGGAIPELLLDLLRQGKTYEEISKRWRCSKSIVGKWAKDYGVDLRSQVRRAAAQESKPRENAS